MRILVVGAGVIGSVYGGKLFQGGHDVVLLARGDRLAQLRAHGLVLEDGASGRRSTLDVPVVAAPDGNADYDLVLVPVRRDQLTGTVSMLSDMTGRPDVLFFGNAAGLCSELAAALGTCALFGFPAAGGVRDGTGIRYVLIGQQPTMLAEPDGVSSTRVTRLRSVFGDAGFKTIVSGDVEGWLVAHAAFVVPIAFALYRVGTSPARLAADRPALQLMVRATREGFKALLGGGNAEIPWNLRVLYLRMPEAFAVQYWRRIMAGERGELWFGAHSRAAPEEMASLAAELTVAIRRTGKSTPALAILLSGL